MPIASALLKVRHRSLFCTSAILALFFTIPTNANRAGNTLTFHSDDPLLQEPETQDASRVQEWENILFIDLASNLFGTPGVDETGVRSGNANTIDEVPDSSWFTNRILARPVSIEEAVQAGRSAAGIAPGPWTVTATKEIGVAPGFTIVDSAGETWFISFDARGYPEAATGALLVANKIFWTLGYWQAEQLLTAVRPEQLLIGDTADVRTRSGKKRQVRKSDLDATWDRAHRSADGSYRAVAARRLPGRPLGGFRYHGTRPDDPNDIVPHEHRRELRALKVFAAWTNLVDLKAGNTLDTLVTDKGRGLVRHYLQDVGSAFGTGALAPREYFEGWEHLYEGDLVWKRLVTLGFFIRPWQTVPYEDRAAIGRFESTAFDPLTWKPRVTNAALRHAQPDDLFWAARRVMAFSDDMIRALVRTGGYSDARDEQHLADTLIRRRDKIGQTYLAGVTPLVNFTLSPDGRFAFDNAAAAAAVPAPGGGYHLQWSYFDNSTGSMAPIGEASGKSGEGMAAPGALRDAPGTFVRVRVTAIDPPVKTWLPVDAYFRRAANGWSLVGVDRGSGMAPS